MRNPTEGRETVAAKENPFVLCSVIWGGSRVYRSSTVRRVWLLGELGCLWGGSQEASGLFGCSSGGRETEHLLNVLSDGHGAEDVEEDEGAVGVVLAQQVAVRQSLDVGQRRERQLGHYSPIKDGVEHSHQSGKAEADGKHGLHPHHRQVSVVVLQLLFLSFNFLLLLTSCRFCDGFLFLLKFFALFFHFSL